MANDKVLLLIPDTLPGSQFEQALLTSATFQVTLETQLEGGRANYQIDMIDLVILSDSFPKQQFSNLINYIFSNFPTLPVLLLQENFSEGSALLEIEGGFFDCAPVSINNEELLRKVNRALEWRHKLKNYIRLEARRDTKSLQNQLNNLQTLQKISSQITSSLDLDQVLKTVVDASVDLTQAEEGSLLLLDEDTGDLYMRASRNFREDFVKTFRLPAQDSLVGKVLLSGEALLIDEDEPQKITTSYFVHSMIYVPLRLDHQIIGVLGVDNRMSRRSFTKDHLALVSSLADFAAIAIQNARLFSNSQTERNKLETILTNIEDGVIIRDLDGRLILINRKAKELFLIQEPNIAGKRASDVIHNSDLLEFMGNLNNATSSRVELSMEDGRVFYAQLTTIQGIGSVITLQDITNLKELDRIKSDFVNTVSHDLRSPLTAILGYVELIERVGPINDQQKEFIHRVQISVHNITSLINDLLDLGRIEAGFDSRKEFVPISTIIHYTVDGLRSRAIEKKQQIQIDEMDDLPLVLGNPVRLRQMLTNLITNSIKYTPEGGEITVLARDAEEQIIVQVNDNGQGIPTIDQPYIFDKFYRAGNVSSDVPGTGLGLAIVKSIIENHNGRIWVDSSPGKGSSFTIVLPVEKSHL